MVVVLRQTGPLHFQTHVMFMFVCCVFHGGVLCHNRGLLGGIVSLFETQELSCGLENATRASINIGMSRKWVKSQF